jgi:hypothetical protein
MLVPKLMGGKVQGSRFKVQSSKFKVRNRAIRNFP